jgi:hypothetical protein
MPFILSKDPFLVLISPQPHPLSRLDLAFVSENDALKPFQRKALTLTFFTFSFP